MDDFSFEAEEKSGLAGGFELVVVEPFQFIGAD
jgi:hypothetical protein